MRTTFALAGALILATTAAAEPQLLVEFHWGQTIESRVPDRAQIGINARLPFTDPLFQAYLSDWRTDQQVGHAFIASPDHVSRFETIFSDATGHWFMSAAFEFFHSSPNYTVDDIWNMPRLGRPNEATAITHVPRRGFGLTGYRLTEVTQTIDRFIAAPRVPPGVPCEQCWAIDQAQTIRFYGYAIPEPATWLLLLGACLALARFRRR